MDIYYVRHSTVGSQKPYSQETFVRENLAYQIAENVVSKNLQPMKTIRMLLISFHMP